jgi:GT2 family glycosyltransferase
MPKVFSIIVTYNANKNNWLYKCIDSLISSELKTDIIIVDNFSTDTTCEIIKKMYPSVFLIENKQNLGFGKANNIGIKKAYELGADYFFLINQDAWIENETVLKLVKIAKQNSEFGIISPMHLNGKGNALDRNFSYYLSVNFCQNILSDIYMIKFEDKIYSLKFVNAACWLISRSCIETVGGFSPTFFHYGEDVNYCQRLLYHGYKIGVVPDARVYHDREERPVSVFFDDDLKYKRKIVLFLSNPFSINIYKFLFIILRIQNWTKLIFTTKIISSIDLKNLLKNRKISKKKGMQFLLF